ncbi:MAG: hypothetical protein K8L91_18010 [Anaerolineae bacterium]|nr:hypothetical protein [Anaerolineae bacterium]
MNESLLESTLLLDSTPKFEEVFPYKFEFPSREEFASNLLLVESFPPVDQSWKEAHFWLAQTDESYKESVTNLNCQIRIQPNKEILLVGLDVQEFVKSQFEAIPDIRNKLIKWSVVDINGNSLHQGISKYLQDLWDGLRVLPYTENQILKSLGNLVVLLLYSEKHGFRYDAPFKDESYMEVVKQSCFGELIEIEFGAGDGSYSRSYVPKEKLLWAVREDVESYIAIQYRDFILGNIEGLLQAVRTPSCLFNFERLTDVFVEYIVPFQILKNREVKYYTPARVTVLGLP